jgi:hypothetical protein
MAYALFNSGAAAAYANSFRQRNPYGGFENIKSDIGKETLGKIPFLNFKAEVEMAKAGLQEYGATVRQKYHDDANVERTDIMYGDKDKGSTSKKAALARLMSGSGAAAKRTGGVTSASVLGLLDGNSPMDGAIGFSRQNNALNNEIFGDHSGFNAGLAAGVRTMPKDSSGGGRTLSVQASPTPVLKPAARTPVTSEEGPEDILGVLLEGTGLTLPPIPETPGAKE